MGGYKPRPFLTYFNDPDRANFDGNTYWCWQRTIHDVFYTIFSFRRTDNIFLLSDIQQTNFKRYGICLIKTHLIKEFRFGLADGMHMR